MDENPRLSAARLAQRREHLMNSINTVTPRRARARKRVLGLAGGISIALAAGGGVVAVAGTPAVFKQSNGAVVVDTASTRPAYDGKILTGSELASLNAQGKATFSINAREAACQGVELFFDTKAELDSYAQELDARDRVRRAAGTATGADPCAAYADAPRFVTSPPAPALKK